MVDSCRHEKPEGATFCPTCGKEVGQVRALDAAIECLEREDNTAYYAYTGELGGAKWYEHEDDMRAISARFPEILFTLHGEGEENDDIWNKYFLNGKCQVAQAVIQIPEFDEGELE